MRARTRSSPSRLEHHLGYWMRRVSNEVSGAFARALRDQDVSVAEWVTLRLLWGEPMTTSGDLAASTGMTKGAVSKVLDKLEEKGLVMRAQSLEDNRVQQLALTRDGVRRVPLLATLADQNDQRFFDCLRAGERTRLRKLLQKLTNHHQIGQVPVD